MNSTRYATKRTLLAALYGVAMAMNASAALAQDEPVLIDQGREDAQPLADSLRLVPFDMRTPTGFDAVYRVRAAGGGVAYARVDGGVTAVFPRSEYVPVGAGQLAVIPAGTVFHIGTYIPPQQPVTTGPMTTARIDRSAGGALDLRAQTGLIDQRTTRQTMLARSPVPADSTTTDANDAIAQEPFEQVQRIEPDPDPDQPATPWASEDDRVHRVAVLLATAVAEQASIRHVSVDED